MDPDNEDRGIASGRVPRLLGAVALVAAFGLVAAMSWRTITSVDLGYHLAYGDEFLDRGRLVDSSRFIYTDVAPKGIGGGLDFAAGGWYEPRTGRYRFTSPSYASEIVMSMVYRWGGATGLCLLRAVLLLGTFAAAALIMRRLDVGAAWMAAGIVLIAMTAYPRFLLRPELFAYLLLAVQLRLLLSRRIGPAVAGALVLIQLVSVQFHSYWVFGPVFSACFFVDAAARATWIKAVRGWRPDGNLIRRTKWLGGIVAAQIAAAFVNPWTWRIPALPIQMLLYMRRHNITAGPETTSGHPWARVAELYPAFSSVFFHRQATYAFAVVLAVALVGGVACVWKRRWAWLLLLVVMGLAALKMRRNIAPGAIFMVPVAMGALALAGRGQRRRGGVLRYTRYTAPAVAVAVVAAAVWWTVSVVRNRFYYNQRDGARFGAGLSRAVLAIDVAERLRDLPDDVRVFAPVNSSSSLLYFSRSDGNYRDMPLLTNGWAYPPRTLNRVERICYGREQFGPFAKKHNVGIVVAPCLPAADTLASKLLRDKRWTPVHMGLREVVFVRGESARKLGDWPDAGDVIALARQADLHRPAYTLNVAANSLANLGLWDQAIAVARACVERADPSYPEGWNVLGRSLATRGREKRLIGDATFTSDFREARECFLTALRLRPDYPIARRNLGFVEGDLNR